MGCWADIGICNEKEHQQKLNYFFSWPKKENQIFYATKNNHLKMNKFIMAVHMKRQYRLSCLWKCMWQEKIWILVIIFYVFFFLLFMQFIFLPIAFFQQQNVSLCLLSSSGENPYQIQHSRCRQQRKSTIHHFIMLKHDFCCCYPNVLCISIKTLKETNT